MFFTTPELLEIGGLPFVSPYEKPTRAEALNYYRKVVGKYDLQVSYGESVLSVQRESDQFTVETRTARGVRRGRHAHNVLMAIGYYGPSESGRRARRGSSPRAPLLFGAARLLSPARRVIVGGGNSAAEAALECFRAGAHVTLVHRRPELRSSIKYWVKPDIENRIKQGSVRGALSTPCVTEIMSDVGRRPNGGSG